MPKNKDTKESARTRGQSEERSIARRERDQTGITEAPMALFGRLREELDRVFDNFGFGRSRMMPAWRDFSPGIFEFGRGMWHPEVEVFEREGDLVIRADLPGLNKDDVKVEVTDNAITIEGERRNEQEERREGYYRSERSYGTFRRTIPLPEGVDAEDANASFRNGVLEITLHLPEGATVRGRRIEIKDASEGEAKPRAQAAGRGR